MNLQQTADAVNQEIARLGVDYHWKTNREGLVARPEPGRNPPALRMGSGWWSAVYHADYLLDYLRCLRLAPKERVAFWANGAIWRELRERNLEMLDHASPVRHNETREVREL